MKYLYWQFPQYFRLTTEKICRNRHDIHQIIDIVDIQGYEDWFESQKENQTKIQECLHTNLVHSLRLMTCCQQISERILDVIFFLFCSEKSQNEYDITCTILHYISRPHPKSLLFEIIEKSKICTRGCPIDPRARQRLMITDDMHQLMRRQFDLASTFDNIRQLICSDAFGASAQNVWTMILAHHHDPQNYRPDEKNNLLDFVLYMSLFRLPSCCLLYQQLEG